MPAGACGGNRRHDPGWREDGSRKRRPQFGRSRVGAGCILNRTRAVKMETPVQSMLSSIANGNPGLSGLGSLDRQAGRPLPELLVANVKPFGIRDLSVCRFHQAVQSPIQAACLKDEKAIFQTQRRSLSKKQVIRTILLPGMLMLMGSMAPALAQLVVGGLEFPPNYDTFQPPAVGGSYVDPVFGSTVRRMFSRTTRRRNGERSRKI